MKPNTNYGIRSVSDDEVLAAFGSLAACIRLTGGDLPTILFYLHNEDRIAGGQDCAHVATDDYAVALRHRAQAEQAAQLWDSALESKAKPTVTAVASSLRVSRSTAAKLLHESGRRVATA